jgi:hypothetical protein
MVTLLKVGKAVPVELDIVSQVIRPGRVRLEAEAAWWRNTNDLFNAEERRDLEVVVVNVACPGNGVKPSIKAISKTEGRIFLTLTLLKRKMLSSFHLSNSFRRSPARLNSGALLIASFWNFKQNNTPIISRIFNLVIIIYHALYYLVY